MTPGSAKPEEYMPNMKDMIKKFFILFSFVLFLCCLNTALAQTYTGYSGTNYPESRHNYSNNCDDTWIYTADSNVISLEVTFSSSTRTESTDYIYLYDGDGTQIGKYFSSQLTGETVTIPGNTLKIRLVTDEDTAYYGFSITDIKAVEQIYSGTDYRESEHPYAADMDQTWVYRSEGAKTLTVNFESSGIKTGDQFWVLTGSGAVAYYGKGSSGTVLFGLPDSVTVPGDTVRFRLKSGSAGGGSYGFKIASIVPGSTAPVVPEEDYLECDVVTFDDQYPESDHQYFGNTDKVWKYTCSGAGSLDVTFSSQTMVESNVDYIYLYDADQNQTGVYTGSALAGKTIHFNGSSFYIARSRMIRIITTASGSRIFPQAGRC